MRFKRIKCILAILLTLFFVMGFFQKYLNLASAETKIAYITKDESEYNRIRDLYYEGEYEKAIEEYRTFLKKYPDSEWADDAQYDIASSYEYLEDYGKAVKEYQKVIDKYPESDLVESAQWSINYLKDFYSSTSDFTEELLQGEVDYLMSYLSPGISIPTNWELTDEEIREAIELGKSSANFQLIYNLWIINDMGKSSLWDISEGEPVFLILTPFRQVALWTNSITSHGGVGSYEGIGVIIEANDKGEIIIKEVFDNSPAQKSGLLPGDIIRKIDGKAVDNMALADINNLVRGPAGTKVMINIKRGEVILSYEVTREVVEPTYSVAYMREALKEYENLLPIAIALYGDRADFAKDYHCIVKVGDKVLQPVKVQTTEIADKTQSWPESPTYFAWNSYYFPKKDIPRDATIRIIVLEDPKADWTVDLSKVQ